MAMAETMSRGEMIRRLDDASREIENRLTNGPITDEERHALGETLGRLLPIIADSLQDQEDQEAAAKLMNHALMRRLTPVDDVVEP